MGQNDYRNSLKCVTYRYSGLVQVECNEISFGNEEISEDVTHLIIKCSNPKLSSNITALGQFQELMFLSISQCSINSIPNNTFHNLSNLRMVHLDNLNIERFPENMFMHTLKIENLYFSDLFNLSVISPFILNEELKIKEINLVQLHISSEILLPFLTMTYKTLEKLSWINSVDNLTFNPVYFSHFNLNELKLSRNQIKDFQFLEFTRAKIINLNYNNLGIKINSLKKISNITIELKFGFNAIEGVFPQIFVSSRTNIKVLHINNNKINGFGVNLLEIFPKLEYLDASYNLIIQITDSYKSLFISSFVNLIGNSLFCGCNMNFVLQYMNKSNKLSCTTLRLNERNELKLSNSITNLSKVSEFMCIPPKINIWINHREQMVDINSKYTPKDAAIIQLYKCEYLQIKCIVKGDPLPQLEVININEVLITSVMLQNLDPITISSPLMIIRHSSLSNKSQYNFLKCTGTNSFGIKDQIIYFQKNNGMRPKNYNMDGIMLSYSCLKSRGKTVQFFSILVIFLPFIQFLIDK